MFRFFAHLKRKFIQIIKKSINRQNNYYRLSFELHHFTVKGKKKRTLALFPRYDASANISLIDMCKKQSRSQHKRTRFQRLKGVNRVFVQLLKTSSKLFTAGRDKGFSVHWNSLFTERKKTLTASSSQCLFQSGRDKRQTDRQWTEGEWASLVMFFFFFFGDRRRQLRGQAAFVAAEKAPMRTNDNGCHRGAAWWTGQWPRSVNSDRDAWNRRSRTLFRCI